MATYVVSNKELPVEEQVSTRQWRPRVCLPAPTLTAAAQL